MDSGSVARKARLVAEGEDVQPVNPSEWGDDPSLGGSTPETRAELEAARSELMGALPAGRTANPTQAARAQVMYDCWVEKAESVYWLVDDCKAKFYRSEEHTSELQSLMRISYAVFCVKKNKLNYA